MTMGRDRASGLLAVLALASTVVMIGAAAAFPDKPVNYIIPFGEGGESDISARLQIPHFKDEFATEISLTYKPGGGGAIAWKALNSMPADGHTIMGVNLPHIAIQPMRSNAAYATRDLTPVYWFHYTPDAIVVRRDSPFETLGELITYAKDNPGQLTFSGSGRGTANHLAQVSFDKLADIESQYIPFKGSAAAVTALQIEQVSAQWGYTTVGIANAKSVRLLAVAMEDRHPAFPDVPTFRELGFEMVTGAFRGIAVPAETPEDRRQAWSDMIAAVNADPAFRDGMERAGFALVDIPYSEMDAFMEERLESYTEAARQAGIL